MSSEKIDLSVVGSPPANVATWLQARGFSPVEVNGATLWKRGDWIGSWDEAPAVFTEQSNKERLALERENEKLREVSTPRSWMTGEFWLHLGGVAVAGVLAYQGEILQFADTLGPGWSKAANVVVTVTIMLSANRFITKRTAEKAAETVAKEQVIGQERRQG